MISGRKAVLLISVVLVVTIISILLMTFVQSDYDNLEEHNPVVLNVILWDYDKNIYDQRIIRAFEEENPDIRINTISYPAEFYIGTLLTLIDTGVEADIIYVNQQQTNFPLIAERDILLPLDSLVSEYMLDFNCYPDLGALCDRETGELLSLPYRKDKLHLFYNRTLFDAVGMAYPEDGITWGEFEIIANELTQKLREKGYSDKYGALFTLNDWRLMHMFNGGYFDYLSGSFENIQKGLWMLKRMEKDGVSPFLSDLERLGVSQRYFELGNSGMFVHGTWYTHYLYQDTLEGNIDFEWGIVSCPVWNEGDCNDDSWMDCIGILQTSEHPDEAFRFIMFATGQEGARIMAEERMMPAYVDANLVDYIDEMRMTSSDYLSEFMTDFNTPSHMLTPDETYLVTEFSSIFAKSKLGLLNVSEMVENMKNARAGIS